MSERPDFRSALTTDGVRDGVLSSESETSETGEELMSTATS